MDLNLDFSYSTVHVLKHDHVPRFVCQEILPWKPSPAEATGGERGERGAEECGAP